MKFQNRKQREFVWTEDVDHVEQLGGQRLEADKRMSFFIRKLNRNLSASGKRVSERARRVDEPATCSLSDSLTLSTELSPQKSTNDGKSKKFRKSQDDEEILSDDEVLNGTEEPSTNVTPVNNNLAAESDEETDQQKKVKAAKRYLSELQDIERLKENDEGLDNDAINAKLKEDVLKRLGTLYVKLADSVEGVQSEQIKTLRNGHQKPVTCAVVSADNQYVYSVSKDSSIVKWSVATGRKLKTIKGGKKGSEETHVGHTTAINTITVSTDGKFLATGCDSNLINVWNPETLEFVHRFRGHSGRITGLIIRKFSHTLYSISKDRSLRVWDLDTMCYVQTLFGHQEVITSIDMLIKERAVTAGGFDSTLRLWKIAEETQLIFQGKGESVECVRYLDEQHFVSGTMNGTLSLWSVQKKRPLFTREQVHGCDSLTNTPNWIASIAAQPFSDLFATGSCDGSIRLWKVSKDRFDEIHQIPLNGFVNSLQFINEGQSLVAAVGQEHRLGRWWRVKECKNSVVIIPFRLKESKD